MTLKIKFAIWFAAIVSAVLLFTFLFIYSQSAEFREEEFFLRLKQKALTTHRLLIDVNEIDSNLLKIIDRNALNVLPNELVLIYDQNHQLIYCSNDDLTPATDTVLLKKTKRDRETHQTFADKSEQIGLLLESGGKSNIVIASALDVYGFSKLSNLLHTLYVAWFLGLGISVVLAYLYVRNIVGRPLSRLTGQVAKIGASDLRSRLKVPVHQDELTVLAASFNDLLDRLEKSLAAQKSFIHFASHELRTPLANMLSETENTLSKERQPEIYRKTLVSLREEQGKLIDLTNALLMMSNQEASRPIGLLELRVDEVLYQTIEEMRATNPDFRVVVNFKSVPADERTLCLPGHLALLRLAFRNLLENACRYSPNQTAVVEIFPEPSELVLFLENEGGTLTPEEAGQLFTPFFRGGNTAGKRGFGLGLVIAKNILDMHGLEIGYSVSPEGMNRFAVRFGREDGLG